MFFDFLFEKKKTKAGKWAINKCMKLDGKREKPPERIEMGGMGTISITRLFKFHSHPPISTLHLGGLISHFISAISWWIQACDAPLYTKNGINLVSRNNFPAPGFTLSGFWLRGCWFAFAVRRVLIRR